MKGIFTTIVILVFLFIGCASEKSEIKVVLLNDQVVLINDSRCLLGEFAKQFADTNQKIEGKYDIVLQVNDGVSLGTLQRVKKEFSKVMDDINEIRYSAEEPKVEKKSATDSIIPQ